MKLKFLLKKSLLKTIENSVGTKMFRSSYYILAGKETDILKNGGLSCALYVSTVLYVFKLIAGPHATVAGTIKDLEKSGWRKVSSPGPGDVLVWRPAKFKNGSKHSHVGFCLASNYAISNSSKLGYPVKHHITFGTKGTKPIIKIASIYRYELGGKRG